MARKWLPSAFTSAYIEAALWSTNDESDEQGGEPLDKNYSESDIAPETLDKMYADCADFQDRFYDLIENDDSPEIRKHGRDELAGHDFWLTRNGHGAGFWDGGWPQNGDALTAAAKEYGEFYLYVGDDGQIHGPPPGAYGVRAPRAREIRYPKTPSPQRHHVSPRVRDFDTLEDLVAHAGRELGATHVSGDGPQTKIYFPRGGTHSYEEAKVWRKGGYWHAEGPGARAGVSRLPAGARPIGGRQRAAEARGGIDRDKIQAALAIVHHNGRRPEAVRDAILNTGLNDAEIDILLNAIHVRRSDLGPLSSQVPARRSVQVNASGRYTRRQSQEDATRDDVFLDGYPIGTINGPSARSGRKSSLYRWTLRPVSSADAPPFGMQGASGEARSASEALNALIRADKARMGRREEHFERRPEGRHSWKPGEVRRRLRRR